MYGTPVAPPTRDCLVLAADDTPKPPRGVFSIEVIAGKSQKLIDSMLPNRPGNQRADIQTAKRVARHSKSSHSANFAGSPGGNSCSATGWEIWEVLVFFRAEAGSEATLSLRDEAG